MGKTVRSVRLSKISVPGKRMRGGHDVAELAESMAKSGQLQDILLDQDMGLVFGWHRLQAARLNGWERIRAEIREFASPEERRLAEIDENLHRHELTALEKIEHVSERVRILERMGRKKGPGRPRKNAPESGGFSTKEIAGSLGIGASTARWYRQVHDDIPPVLRESLHGSRFADNMTELHRIGRMSREEQGMLLVNLEHEKAGAKPQPGGVRELQRDMHRTQTRTLGRELPEPYGRYRAIAIDPPWASEISGDYDPMGKLKPAYEEWPLERIAKLPLDDLAWENDCHLYLWATSSTLPFVFELLERWGFVYHDVIPWIKDRAIPGRYYNRRHELVVFATRGTRPIGKTDVDDVLYGSAESREHSSKPASFYEMVEQCSPGPRLELFSRRRREGWETWGSQVPREARDRLPGPDDADEDARRRRAASG